MRAVLWIAILVAAFVLAWQVQDRWAAERREERDAAYARLPDGGGDLPEGYSRAVVGAPSGAAPVLPSESARPVGRPAAPAPEPSASGTGSLRRHVVQKGDVLSKICSAYYGTARKDVVDAVARANGLADPQALRVGQQLVLPPLDELRSAPRR